MLTQHKEAFFQAAQQFKCWIGLREPNPLAERWIGRSGFRPKGENCKAKTADNPTHRWAGLVVSPVLMPDAFMQDSLQASVFQALEKWKDFLQLGRLPIGFTCSDSGLEKGVVRQNGQAIFADYDLMTIVRSDEKGSYLFTSDANELVLMKQVIPRINQLIGIEMIQHGPGARASERVLYFGPGRRFELGLSSMPKKGH